MKNFLIVAMFLCTYCFCARSPPGGIIVPAISDGCCWNHCWRDPCTICVPIGGRCVKPRCRPYFCQSITCCQHMCRYIKCPKGTACYYGKCIDITPPPYCERCAPEGNCLGGGSEKKWYYNKDNKQCEYFKWGGCFGGNKFDSKEECEAICSPEPNLPMQGPE